MLKENGAVNALLNLFVPNVCALCNEKEVECLFCTGCAEEVEKEGLTGARCSTCCEPFTAKEAVSHTCGDCLKSPPPFTKAVSLYFYRGAVLDALHRLKYHGDIGMAGPLGRLLLRGIQRSGLRPDVIVPVPLYTKRLKRRGFNQSLLIAKEAAKALRIPIDFRGLSRIRDTGAQVGLSRTERKKNIKGAFRASHPQEYNGRTVLLVDDVYTTGATAKECAAVLKESGASTTVITLARAAKF